MKTIQEKEREIEQQIDDDVQKYNTSIYDGFLPQSFIDYFKKSLMVIPPGNHQYNMEKVKDMISRRPDEVRIIEVGMMINLIYACPFRELYDSVEQGIEMTMEFDKVREGFNKTTEDIERKLALKRQTLRKIYGLGSNTANILAKA